jgi:hypothetical protein
VGLLDTELESESVVTAVDVAEAEVVKVRTWDTDCTEVAVARAVALAVGDAVGATEPDSSREPLVRGVADAVLSAVREFGAVMDIEGEGEAEADTVEVNDTSGEVDCVAEPDNEASTVREARALVGDKEAEEDTLALGVTVGRTEGEVDTEADTEGEPEAVVADALSVVLTVTALVRDAAAVREACREPLTVGELESIGLSLGATDSEGCDVQEGEPDGDGEPSTVPLGENEAVTVADSEGEAQCVGVVVAVATGVSVESAAVEETLAVGVTVSVVTLLAVGAGVPLR